MGTVRGGQIICDKCGAECKALYGFAMVSHKVASSTNEDVKKITQEIDRIYGKHDFVICWQCTVEMMHIPTLAQQRAEHARSAKKKETDNA